MLFLQQLLETIAPPICLGCGAEGSLLCEACTTVKLTPFGSRCYVCSSLTKDSQTCSKCARLGGPRHVWITTAYDELAEQLVGAYKYVSSRGVGRILVRLMAEKLPLNKKLDYIVVPLPAAARRRRERGFDHAYLLAKQIAASHKLICLPALARRKDFRQVGASRSQRIKQAQASYFVSRPALVAGQNVLLVDDVVTTGATLQAAAKALRQAGAKRVDAVVFAKKI